jgi:hypothetical protein
MSFKKTVESVLCESRSTPTLVASLFHLAKCKQTFSRLRDFRR